MKIKLADGSGSGLRWRRAATPDLGQTLFLRTPVVELAHSAIQHDLNISRAISLNFYTL